MPAPAKIKALVARFEEHKEQYLAGHYNETQLRRDFLDPFFKALGWDIDNEKGKSEAYREVIHEDAIRIAGVHKAPDYCMRAAGVRRFFVEAKKPAVDIKSDASPAFQVRRYAWSAKLPLSILTDFHELSIYDCRIKPLAKDGAAVARIKYFTYEEYVEKWDEIAAIFSPQAIENGSFDTFAEASKLKKGTEEVDDAFLEDIEEWRVLLAKNIAVNNTKLSQREVNFAVQLTIDRIIFLRICEDRGVETDLNLLKETNGPHIYGRLKRLFRDADDRYNSGLFHFKDEKDQAEAPDTLSLDLVIDDDVLKKIISHLYYPESPYAFSVFSADILGQVYERFLGKVIRLTEGHRAKVEEKPEVRKAGGVYYTPTYIVDYIVKHTVGKLLEGKTPAQVSELKIVDPACGSGSFLLEAYQLLLDWHLQYYTEHDPKKWRKALTSTPAPSSRLRSSSSSYVGQAGGGGEVWRLSTAERKRILLSNIFGVDIDSQAVEVTKLSLLLKVLEGETQQSIQDQFSGMRERVLPDLGKNIQCGNSLIGPDFYAGRQRGMFEMDDEERLRINVFDWELAFPQVFGRKNPGFDAVIGNPPYIRIQALKEWAPLEVEYYKKRYKSASRGNYDIYVVFVERGLTLLNKSGLLGFILPHKFFNAHYGEPLRDIITQRKHLKQIVHFGDQQVFNGATTYTCLLFLSKTPITSLSFEKVENLEKWQHQSFFAFKDRKTESIDPPSFKTEWNFVCGKGSDLFKKLRDIQTTLKDLVDRIGQGIRTSANEVYVLDTMSNRGPIIRAYSKQLAREVELEKEAVHSFLQGREIKPYRVLPSGKIVIIPYEQCENKACLIPEDKFRARYPLAFQYLVENRDYLSARESGRMQGDQWYAYIYPKNIDLMSSSKILVPDIADRSSFALDKEGQFAFTSGYGIVLNDPSPDLQKYILGLLNSPILDFFLKKISTTMRGGFFRYFTQYIEQLPIRLPDHSIPSEKKRHDHIIDLVDQMLTLNTQLPAAKTPHEQESLKRQIEATDRQIDQLVYEVYGLGEEEIGIIEGRG